MYKTGQSSCSRAANSSAAQREGIPTVVEMANPRRLHSLRTAWELRRFSASCVLRGFAFVGLVVSYGTFVGLSWLCSRDTIAMKSWVWQTHEQNPRHFCLFPRVEIDAVLT